MNVILLEECDWSPQQGYWPGSDIYSNQTQTSNAWHNATHPAPPHLPCTLATPSRAQNSHGLGEESHHLLAALIVSPTHSTFVKLPLGAQLPITASLDALALDAD